MTRILGIDFFQGDPDEAAERALTNGLTVAPSGPNLADLNLYPAYQKALSEADLVVVDSGFLVLCWKLLTGQSLRRLSGLLLLQRILIHDRFQEMQNQLWVMPTAASIEHSRDYLSNKFCKELKPECFYSAPVYPQGEIQDRALLQLIRDRRPGFILINVAGGKQEVLGAWLKRQLENPPPIVCTGAAIAFLTGEQTSIPQWGDRYFLGWLLRIIWRPRQYLPRYWQARRLWKLVRRHREKAPPPLSNVTD